MKNLSRQSLQDVNNIPADILEIILDFEKFIDHLDINRFESEVDVILKLPHSKKKVAEAFRVAIDTAKDDQLKKYLLVLGSTFDMITNPKLFKTLKENWR